MRKWFLIFTLGIMLLFPTLAFAQSNAVLANVAVIGNQGENIDSFRKTDPATLSDTPPARADKSLIREESKALEMVPVNTFTDASQAKIKVSPRARCIAQAKGISLQQIKGSGPNGRIIVRDVEALASKASQAEKSPAPSPPSFIPRTANFQDG